MKITRSWCSVTGEEKCRLEISTDGGSLAEAMTKALRLVQATAHCDGGAAWEAYRSWRDGLIASPDRQVEALRAELEALCTSYRACQRERDEAIAQARAARDLAAVRNGIAEELVKTREELAQARRKALTEAADALRQEATNFAGASHRAAVVHASAFVRQMIDKPRTVPVNVPNAGVNFEVKPNTTNAPGVEPSTAERDLLAAILAAVEGIRADLQRARDARRS